MGQELNQAGEVSKLMEIKRKEQLRLLAYQQKQKQKQKEMEKKEMDDGDEYG